MSRKTISDQINEKVASRRQFAVDTKHEQNVCLQEAKKLQVKVITSKDNKHKVYDVVPCYRSRCCGAPVQSAGRLYNCNKCGKECQIK